MKGFDEAVWKSKCREIVTTGNLAKFQQNQALREYLLSTAGTVIVEASPYDRVWGIGLKEDDQRGTEPMNWRGSNLLGFALMDCETSWGNFRSHRRVASMGSTDRLVQLNAY